MKARLQYFFILLALTLGMLLGTTATTRATTINWTNTSGGNWSNTNNWSPHQIPTNTDSVLITSPGTYTIVYDPSTSSSVTNFILGSGSAGSGVQTLLITNLEQDSSFGSLNQFLVTNGGVIVVTNGSLSPSFATIDKGGLVSIENGAIGEFGGTLTVENDGVLNIENGETAGVLTVQNGGVLGSSDSSLDGTLTVTNQGVVNVNGTLFASFVGYEPTFGNDVTVAEGGVLNITGTYVQGFNFTIAAGGTLNIASAVISPSAPAAVLIDYGTINNSGTIVITNGELQLVDEISEDADAPGELANLPGGILDLQGNANVTAEFEPDGYETYPIYATTNLGTILASGTNNIIYTPLFDTHLGSVTNLSGVLQLGIYQTNLVGNYYAAPGATIQFEGADLGNANTLGQITLGTPLVLAGTGQYQLTSGYLYLPDNVPTNLGLQSDSVSLGPDFQGGTITNLTVAGSALISQLPVSGVLDLTSAAIPTNLVILNGGRLITAGSGIASLTISNGGSAVVNGDRLGALEIAHGGNLSVTGAGISFPGLTNAGIVNLDGPVSYSQEILNLAGGVIYFLTNDTINITSPSMAFINQGSVIQNAGAGNTNSIIYQTDVATVINGINWQFLVYSPFAFDTSQGTVTNLSGTLILPGFTGTLSGVFYAAAGATIGLGGGATNAPLTAGTNLSLSGDGDIQFVSGFLYCSNDIIPHLSLTGGQLLLGPAFQGGAITNLTLDGIALTNSLSSTSPVTGDFTVLNSGSPSSINAATFGWSSYFGSGVYGNYAVSGKGVLIDSNAVFNGAVTVTNGGVFDSIGGQNSFYNPVAVDQGGTFYTTNGFFNSPSTIAAGGVMDVVGHADFDQPLTNSGTIDLTNGGIGFTVYGTIDQGEVVNLAGGIINFYDTTLPGVVGSAVDGNGPLINAGQINFLTGQGYAGLVGGTCVNSGTITTKEGALVLESLTGAGWTFTPSSSLQTGINSTTSYGTFICSTNFPEVVGNMAPGGTFVVTLANGYVPTNGTAFNVLSYGSETGNFSALNLPSTVSWKTQYGPTNLSLIVGAGAPQFETFDLVKTNFILGGIGGTAGSNYFILTSTNLTIPLSDWTALTTNTFDGSGDFHFTNPVSVAKPRQFFILKLR